MTSSAVYGSAIVAATCGQDVKWDLLLAMPMSSLATSKARALLPDTYSRADAVANVQSTALLVSAFALDRGDLLKFAMQDRIHQPYRMEACPLLPLLLPLAHKPEFLGVALSGAGPSVLLIAKAGLSVASLIALIRERAQDDLLEVIATTIAGGTVVTPNIGTKVT